MGEYSEERGEYSGLGEGLSGGEGLLSGEGEETSGNGERLS